MGPQGRMGEGVSKVVVEEPEFRGGSEEAVFEAPPEKGSAAEW